VEIHREPVVVRAVAGSEIDLIDLQKIFGKAHESLPGDLESFKTFLRQLND
jgi:hypothetical protein